MNIIFIVSDTLRKDHLGCCGNEWINTPNIDNFASNSLVFNRASCASFPTVPNRRDLFTGRFTATYTGWAPLARDETVLAQVLSESSYKTMMIADTYQMLRDGYYYDRGFNGFEWIRGQESDRWKTNPEKPEYQCDPEKIRNAERIQSRHRRNTSKWEFESDRFVAQTMSKSSKWLEKNYESDFFLYVDTFDPHEPWDPPKWYVDMYDPDYEGDVVDYPRYGSTDIYSTEELNHSQALYAAEVTLVDRWFGYLMRKIKDLGLLEDSMIILTSDHGFLLGEHNHIGKAKMVESGEAIDLAYIPLYREISELPLIVSLPGIESRKTEAFVQPMDVMPTILDELEVDIPDTVQGESFAPVLEEGSNRHRDFTVSTPFLGSGAPVTMKYDEWTGIIYPERQAEDVGVDYAVDGYPKEISAQTDREDLLFNNKEDPQQLNSVASEHQEILEKMKEDLLQLLQNLDTDERLISMWKKYK